MAILKQSTAYTRMFLMVDSTDHVTGKTGLTVTATISKAGAAFAAAGGAVTEVSGGWYKLALNTTDTNTLGDLAYHLTSAGADPTDFVDQVSAALIDDVYSRVGAPAGASVSADIATVATYVDTEVAAIKAKTDQLTFTTPNQVDATTVTNSDKTNYSLTTGERNSVADSLLDRDMSLGADNGSTTVRTPRQALRALRNKWAIVAGTATIYKEDDATSSWTSTVTTTAGTSPVTSSDPAG